MQKLALILSVIMLSACSEFLWVYKVDIEQGNIIEQEKVDQLVPGLTTSQVRFLLGSPMVADTFNQNRWDYIYNTSKAGEEKTQERLTLYFKDDRLEYFTGDFVPSSATQTE